MSTLNQTKIELSTCNTAKANLRKRAENCEKKLQDCKASTNPKLSKHSDTIKNQNEISGPPLFLEKKDSILEQSIQKFSKYSDIIKNQNKIPPLTLSPENLKTIKSCINKKSLCVTTSLKNICINIKAKSEHLFWWHNLEKTYIPFPHPDVLAQLQREKIEIDLFDECFKSYTPEHKFSKFNFFSTEYYINFKEYKSLLGEFQFLLDEPQ